MTPATRAALASAGFQIGDATDFIGLSPAEDSLVNARLADGPQAPVPTSGDPTRAPSRSEQR